MDMGLDHLYSLDTDGTAVVNPVQATGSGQGSASDEC